MSVASAVKWGIGGLVVDQVVSFILQRKFPQLVHAQPFFNWIQPPWSWLLALGCLSVLLWVAVHNRRYRIADIFLITGFLSNVLSFLFYGHYIDYLPTGISYTNTADLLIVAGCILALQAAISSS